MSDKAGPCADLATRARWQRWEMESLDALRAGPGRRASDFAAERQQANARQREAEALSRARAEGRESGHREGLAQGRSDGYAQGLALGRAEGLEQGHREGFEEGRRDGQAQGRNEGAGQVREQAARLQELANTGAVALTTLEQEVGQALIHLATRIAEQVLRTHLEDHPDQILELVRDVLRSDPQQDAALTLRLHPEDLELVQAALEPPPDAAYRLVADEQMSRGGCLVETPQGSIDATLETRWQRITAALGFPPEAP
ncbi:Flagellar assembly protein FliH OS=Castellaniella defragrans OX=75697 GN=HNR28_000402 PE=3 SV=1 [Castellaniella defragrans]